MSRNIPPLSSLLIKDAVKFALEEDLGRAGDITTKSIISETAIAKGQITLREEGVVAGLDLAEAAFHCLDETISFERHHSDGEFVPAGTTLATITGNARNILSAERVALNYMGRLSGIATNTHRFCEKVKHTKAKICDTRKTTPGLRLLEKYAVLCGGGQNHRFGLDDAVLIKDNHIVVAGGVEKAVKAAQKNIGHMVKIEVEVDTLDQLNQALDAGADIILLDNMSNDQLREAVSIIDGRAIAEASGGVNLETVGGISETGVDLISIGALTHSSPNLDLGLDFSSLQ